MVKTVIKPIAYALFITFFTSFCSIYSMQSIGRLPKSGSLPKAPRPILPGTSKPISGLSAPKTPQGQKSTPTQPLTSIQQSGTPSSFPQSAQPGTQMPHHLKPSKGKDPSGLSREKRAQYLEPFLENKHIGNELIKELNLKSNPPIPLEGLLRDTIQQAQEKGFRLGFIHPEASNARKYLVEDLAKQDFTRLQWRSIPYLNKIILEFVILLDGSIVFLEPSKQDFTPLFINNSLSYLNPHYWRPSYIDEIPNNIEVKKLDDATGTETLQNNNAETTQKIELEQEILDRKIEQLKEKASFFTELVNKAENLNLLTPKDLQKYHTILSAIKEGKIYTEKQITLPSQLFTNLEQTIKNAETKQIEETRLSEQKVQEMAEKKRLEAEVAQEKALQEQVDSEWKVFEQELADIEKQESEIAEIERQLNSTQQEINEIEQSKKNTQLKFDKKRTDLESKYEKELKEIEEQHAKQIEEAKDKLQKTKTFIASNATEQENTIQALETKMSQELSERQQVINNNKQSELKRIESSITQELIELEKEQAQAKQQLDTTKINYETAKQRLEQAQSELEQAKNEEKRTEEVRLEQERLAKRKKESQKNLKTAQKRVLQTKREVTNKKAAVELANQNVKLQQHEIDLAQQQQAELKAQQKETLSQMTAQEKEIFELQQAKEKAEEAIRYEQILFEKKEAEIKAQKKLEKALDKQIAAMKTAQEAEDKLKQALKETEQLAGKYQQKPVQEPAGTKVEKPLDMESKATTAPDIMEPHVEAEIRAKELEEVHLRKIQQKEEAQKNLKAAQELKLRAEQDVANTKAILELTNKSASEAQNTSVQAQKEVDLKKLEIEITQKQIAEQEHTLAQEKEKLTKQEQEKLRLQEEERNKLAEIEQARLRQELAEREETRLKAEEAAEKARTEQELAQNAAQEAQKKEIQLEGIEKQATKDLTQAKRDLDELLQKQAELEQIARENLTQIKKIEPELTGIKKEAPKELEQRIQREKDRLIKDIEQKEQGEREKIKREIPKTSTKTSSELTKYEKERIIPAQTSQPKQAKPIGQYTPVEHEGLHGTPYDVTPFPTTIDKPFHPTIPHGTGTPSTTPTPSYSGVPTSGYSTEWPIFEQPQVYPELKPQPTQVQLRPSRKPKTDIEIIEALRKKAEMEISPRKPARPSLKAYLLGLRELKKTSGTSKATPRPKAAVKKEKINLLLSFVKKVTTTVKNTIFTIIDTIGNYISQLFS